MASFFDDFQERKKKNNKKVMQMVTPSTAVKTSKETKKAIQNKVVTPKAKSYVSKNTKRSFAGDFANRKKVSLPTVTMPTLPGRTMNGSLRTPIRVMQEKETRDRMTQLSTKRKARAAQLDRQKLFEGDKTLNPVQQRAIQSFKADWEAAKARGDAEGMAMAHVLAEQVRRREGFSGGPAGDQFISPELSAKDKATLNQSGQIAMKQAKLDYDRAAADGNQMEMRDAILRMTALRKDMRNQNGSNTYGMDAYGRTMSGGAMTRDQMAAAEKRLQAGLYSTMAAIPGSAMSFFETTNQAIENDMVERNRKYLQEKANRRNEYKVKLDMVRAGKGNPDWGSESWLEQQLRIAENAQKLLTQGTIVDPNLPGQTLMRKSSESAAEALEGLEGIDKDLAQALMSVGQNLPSMALSAIPGVGPAIGAGVMGLQAAGARAWELNEQTAQANNLARIKGGKPEDYGAVTPAEASFRGLLSGFVEAGTEKIGLDRLGKLLTGKAGKNIVKNILAQMGIEGTEESVAYTANYFLDEIAKDPNAEWTQAELWDSFRLGAIAGGMMAGPAQLIGNAQENERRTLNGTNVRNSVENVESGLVRDDYTNRQDQSVMDEIDAASKRLGLTVQFADRVAEGMANASIRGNVVTIERNNRNPVRFLYGHEVAHFMQEASPEAYTNFRAVIANEKEVSDRVEEIMAEGGMNWDQALDEVTADYAGTLIENERILQRFIQENQKNKPMLQRLADAFRGLLQKITGKDKAKVQNAVEALELALEETVKGNRLRTGKEARIENRRAKQTQRWQENRREDLIQRLIQDYPTMEGEMKAQVDKLGIEGVVDAYLNGGNNTMLAAYEEAQTRYSFKRAGDTRRAEEMEVQGETRESIWKATGQTRDTKGNWVEEVDDSGATFYPQGDAKRQGNPDWVRLKELESKMLAGTITQEELEEANALAQNLRGMPKGSTLGDYLDHTELFRAVPGIEDTPFRMEDIEGKGERSARGIAVNRDLQQDQRLSTALHETQHELQHREGRPVGSNKTYWAKRAGEDGFVRIPRKEFDEAHQAVTQAFDALPPEVQRKVREMNRADIQKDYDRAMAIEEELMEGPYADAVQEYLDAQFNMRMASTPREMLPADAYMDTAGEIEARETQKRMNMTAEERRETMPDLGWDRAVFAGDATISMESNDKAQSDALNKERHSDKNLSSYERAYEMVYKRPLEKPKTVQQATEQASVGVIDRLQNLEPPKEESKAKHLPKPGERKVEAVQEDPIPAEDLAYMDELLDSAQDRDLEAEFQAARDLIPGGKTDKATLKEQGKDIGGFAYRKLVDSGDEIRKAGKQAGDKYLYYYYNQAKASTAAAQNMIAMRQTDVNGKEVGESLVDIFGPIKKKGQEYFKDFQDYLLHRHNIYRMGTDHERAMQKQATRYLWDFEDANPEYKGWTLPEIRDAADDGDALAKEYLDIKKEKAFWDSKVKPVFSYDMTPEKSRARVRQYEGRYPEFKDLAKRVYAYNQNLMQYRVDSGLISKDTAEFLQKRYPDYVPTFHQQDGVSTAERGKGTKVGKTVKKATGNTGNNPFVDMDKAMAQQTMSVVRESAKNRFGQRLLNEDISQDYIINVESLAQQKALAELHDEDGFKSEQTNKDNTFTVYKGGKAYEITMTPAMYDAIKSLSKTGESDKLAVKAAIGANNIYKKAITSWNPIFTVKNLAKDLQDALLYTTASPKEFAKNYAEAVRQIKSNGDEWKLYQALGGTASSVYNMDRGVELPKDGAWAKLVGGISYLNLAVEQAPRLAEFMATAKKGSRTQEELMEAMYRAADITTNFGRSGDWTKMLNSSFVPFLNPSIQGVDKLIRTFRDNPKKVGPWLSLAGRVAMLGIAPAIINAALFGDEEDYEELNQRDKDNNFMLPLGRFNPEWEGVWLKFPRGRALAAMGAITNAGIGLAKGKDVDAGELISTVWSNVGVVNPMTSNIMRPLMQTALFDKDNPGKTWYGSDIESKSMQSKKPGERYDERTDEFSKRLGKALGISPAKINYLLDSYTGVFGDIALPLLTPTNPVGKNPLSKAFVTDSTTSNRLSGDFYEMGDQLKYDEQEGDTSATIAYNYWSKVSQDLSKVNEEIRKMENDLSLDNKDKRKKYRDLKAQANEIIREGMANVDAFRKAAEEYDGEINEDTEWDVLVELTRDVLGAEKALEYDGKTTYEKAQEIVKEGGSYESYYDYLQAERALNDIMDAESNLNTLNERNITGAKLTEAQNKVDLLNKEHQDLVEKSLIGSNGWKPTSTDRKLSVLESLELPEEEAFAIWKMKILDSEQRYKMEVLEEAGLPQMDYFRYKMAVKHLNGYEDSSEPGTTKRNSKKDMRVPIINSLDLTPAQKDILYLDVENWAKSGLHKTPWH